jgi:hypothetical protein
MHGSPSVHREMPPNIAINSDGQLARAFGTRELPAGYGGR